jgi:hypothetical protein
MDFIVFDEQRFHSFPTIANAKMGTKREILPLHGFRDSVKRS